MNAVTIEGLCKSYGDRCLLEGVSLTIPEKTLCAIVGKSGSGKSTLLNILGLLESADEGRIFLFGEKLPSPTSRQAVLMRQQVISYMFQSCALLMDESVEKNLLLAMHFLELKMVDKQHRIDAALETLGLREMKQQRVSTLSGGEQQRVAIARCLLKPGRLILADEPTGSLDTYSAETVFACLKSLKEDYGKTVILVTHDERLANQSDIRIELIDKQLIRTR